MEDGLDIGVIRFGERGDEVFGADIGRAELRRDSERPREDFLQTGRKIEHRSSLRFYGRFLHALETLGGESYFSEWFLFEADIFEEYFAEASLFEEEGEEDMFRLDMGTVRIEGDITGFPEDAFGMESQFFRQGKSFHRMSVYGLMIAYIEPSILAKISEMVKG